MSKFVPWYDRPLPICTPSSSSARTSRSSVFLAETPIRHTDPIHRQNRHRLSLLRQVRQIGVKNLLTVHYGDGQHLHLGVLRHRTYRNPDQEARCIHRRPSGSTTRPSGTTVLLAEWNMSTGVQLSPGQTTIKSTIGRIYEGDM